MFNNFFEIFSSTKQVKLDNVGLNWHEDFILSLIKSYRPKVYVELGLYQCVLFNSIEPYAQSLYGVDICSDVGKYMVKSDKVNFFAGNTLDFAETLKNKSLKIDLLFIDADHSKEAVKKDFESFFPYVVDNGLILMHDSYPENLTYTDKGYCGDGYLAVEELAKCTKNYEMMTIPISPGLTICRKRTQQVPWS